MAMYRQYRVRADGKFTYSSIEKRFDDHQAIWPEAIWIEEARFSYIEPLINSGKNYLTMMQGSKEMQRKWWLKNRLRFMDSKWTAGDATKHIILRGYANANITLTPYIDLYCTILYGSQTVQQKTTRGTAVTLVNPLDKLNDTEIHIYSAEQIASVGDLSGLKVGFSDFSAAINLQYVKIGDSSSSYRNENALDLTFGNNVLLETVDARNCVNLGGSRNDGTMVVNSTTPTIDMSNCTGLLAAYFDNTSIKGVEIPRGCPIAHLHLPATTTTLKLLDLKALTDLVVASYANTTTLWIENCNSAVDPLAILDEIPLNSRVRIIGFDMTVSTVTDIEDFYDHLDTMRGLDENGNTVEIADGGAQVSGTIHVSTMTGAKYSELTARYPYITLDVASVESTRTYKTWDGESTISTVTCLNGVPQSAAPSVPNRTSTAQYQYTGIGWSLNQDSQTADFDPTSTTMGDTTVYAAYSRTVRTYTITWVNSDGTTLETDTNVAYGSTPQYNGSTPTYNGQTSTGWNPTPTTVTGNATYTATYVPMYTVTWYNDDSSTVLYSTSVQQGSDAVYAGNTPTSTYGSSFPFKGWDKATTNVQSNLSVYATYIMKQFVNPGFDVSGAYAVQWDYSDTDPSLSRGGLAASFSDPVPATSVSGSGSSQFDNIQPWAGMKEVNILSDGTVIEKSDSRFSYTENDVMVWIPEFWYKTEKNTGTTRWTWAISPTAKTGYSKHPGSGVYVSKYHTTGTQSAMGSKSGVSPLANLTRANFRSGSKAKGSNWEMLDLATWSAIQMLYLVEFASFDSETVLGTGWNTGSVGTVGGTDNAVYHTVKVNGAHNSYRYIEDPYSNMRDWVDGFVASDKVSYVGTDSDSYSDTTTGLTNTGITLPISNEIKGFGYSESADWAFIPDDSVSNTNYNTYVCDRVYSNSGVRVLYVGGDYYAFAYYGFFCFSALSNASNANSVIGSRLLSRQSGGGLGV